MKSNRKCSSHSSSLKRLSPSRLATGGAPIGHAMKRSIECCQSEK